MLNKLNLPVLVTIMCLLLAGVMGLAVLNQGNLTKTLFQKTKKINQDIGTTETLVTRTDYSQTSRKILDWLDNQKDNTGWYILERGCNVDTKTCDTIWNNDEGNQDGLIVTWSRFNFYQQTKNPQDLDIVINDINKFYDKYPNGVTNSLWICKITYDMWNSNLFDQPTKDKLEQICFKTQFPTPEEVEKYWQDITNKTLVIDKTKKIWETWEGYALGVRDFNVNLSYSSDILSRYNWTGKQEYLDLAKNYLNKAKTVYQNNSRLGSDDICLLGLSSLDMYRYGGKNETDLNYVKNLYNETVGVDYKKKDYQTTLCGLMTKKIYEMIEDKTYLSELNRNNVALVSINMDNSGAGESSFFRNGMNGFSIKYKNIIENALIVELLRN